MCLLKQDTIRSHVVWGGPLGLVEGHMWSVGGNESHRFMAPTSTAPADRP